VQTREVLVTAPNSSDGTEQPTTSNLAAVETALSDPLKPETRKARLFLLGVSMVSITIVYTGLVPQQITTLGITFGEANQRSLLFILALVTLYFLVAFVVYGGSDYLSSRYAYLNMRWSEVLTELQSRSEDAQRMQEEFRRRTTEGVAAGLSEEEAAKEAADAVFTAAEAEQQRELIELRAYLRRVDPSKIPVEPEEVKVIRRHATLSPKMWYIRALFGFLLPILVGLYAIYVLLVG
jgi:hypothetical protein